MLSRRFEQVSLEGGAAAHDRMSREVYQLSAQLQSNDCVHSELLLPIKSSRGFANMTRGMRTQGRKASGLAMSPEWRAQRFVGCVEFGTNLWGRRYAAQSGICFQLFLWVRHVYTAAQCNASDALAVERGGSAKQWYTL